jgi:drug/metabolite transporter (DMT)-like permease
VVKYIFTEIPDLDPALFGALRFSLATIVLIPFCLKSRPGQFFVAASCVGLAVFPGYVGQMKGLENSSADKCAFIGALSVVWTAILEDIIKVRISVQTWVACIVAVVGTAYLELKGSAEPSVGDLWNLLQPLGFGTGYILIERLVKEFPDEAPILTVFKIGVVAVCCSMWALMNGNTREDVLAAVLHPKAYWAILYTGVVTTGCAVLVQTYVFRHVTATDAALIITSVPVWSALFAAIWLGESLNFSDCVGAGLIIAACVINELSLVDRLFKIGSYSPYARAKMIEMNVA